MDRKLTFTARKGMGDFVSHTGEKKDIAKSLLTRESPRGRKD